MMFAFGMRGMGQEPPAGQNPSAQVPSPQTVPQPPGSPTRAARGGVDAPLTITLQDALARARKYNVDFNAALTEQGVVHEDKVQARAILFPSVTYNNVYLYTQGNGQNANVPIFIANNAVHEYVSQGNVHEAIGLADLANYRRSRALEAVSRAKAEIAARGLVVTVVQAYYGLLAAERKYASIQNGAAEAQRFFDLSQKLEKGGEVAHSDTIKAQIQYQDRQRDLREAQLAMEKSRLDLAVLLFPDFNENFSVVDDLDLAPPLQSFDELEQAAEANNPDLRVARFSLQATESERSGARAGYFPNLVLDYWYGIDSTNFATGRVIFVPQASGGAIPVAVNNLGSSASATLNIPIWNWGITHSKVVQADLKRKQAQRELSWVQRKLLAQIRSAYDEAQAARSELEWLRSSAELAADSLRLTTLRYQGGAATALEVVDAQNTLTQERNAYADGMLRYRTALAGLQTLTGIMQ
jgi:outer membrane protein TolC